MISRRRLILGAASLAGAAAIARPRPVFAAASQPKTPVNFEVPPGACDCITHIFGDQQKFPFDAGRPYTPELASIGEQLALHKSLHTSRVIIVHPTVYGTDMRCTLDAIKVLGNSARGTCTIDEKTTPDAELDALKRGGISGIRINLETRGLIDINLARRRTQDTIARLGQRNWHLELHTRPTVIEGMKDLLMASQMPVVFDHFARADAAAGVGQQGFGTVLELLKAGKIYVKISAPYLVSTQGPDYPDAGVLAKAIVAANPQRVLWATNWPHPDTTQIPGRKTTDLFPLRQVDDGHLLNLFAKWVPDAATRKMILVDNPARLYGF